MRSWGAVLTQKDWWSYKRWGDPAHLSPLYMDTEKKWPSSSQEKSSHQNSTLLALWSPTFSLYNREKCFCLSSRPVYGILWQQPHVRRLLCSWLCGSIPVSNLQALNTVVSRPESNEAASCRNVVSLVLSFQSWIFLGSNLTGGEKLCTLKRFTGVVSFRFWNQNYTTIWPSNPTLGLYPEKTVIPKDVCTPVFTAALFTTARMWKPPKCPWAAVRIKKMCYICIIQWNITQPYKGTKLGHL